jgi:hypothetical protein
LKKESTNHEKQSIGIVMVAATMALLLIAGTILAPIQASAISQRKSNPQFNNFNDNTNDNTNTAKSRSTSDRFTGTASLKHAIRDGVTVNLEHRDQHMNQENLCYRTNTCRQSDVGQNTLGNDNSVTGFADQSDNLKQSAAAPITPSTANQTTANKTSPTPTPTPTPTPIPVACGTGTIFDVTLQAAIGTDLPLGTVLCLQVVGPNPSAIAIPPIGTPFTVDVSVSPVGANNQCPAGTFAAALTSGVLPSPLSGTTVCVI